MEGWAWKTNCTKRHYFVDGRSLCGHWRVWGRDELSPRYDDIPENCKRCRTKLSERRSSVKKAA